MSCPRVSQAIWGPVPGANIKRLPIKRQLSLPRSVHRACIGNTYAHKELNARSMMHLLPCSPPLLTSLSTSEGLRLAGHVSYAMLFVAIYVAGLANAGGGSHAEADADADGDAEADADGDADK